MLITKLYLALLIPEWTPKIEWITRELVLHHHDTLIFYVESEWQPRKFFPTKPTNNKKSNIQQLKKYNKEKTNFYDSINHG